ncbi:HMG box domain-containing protein [Psidium guajava]|nr:HMG box domain-containing protein [Psidium guajava]
MDEDQDTQLCPDYHDKDSAGENKPVDVTKGRLYVKLKMPTAANRCNGEETGGHGNNDQSNTPQIRKDYVCDFCNKRFSTGKGLGGHKRIHTQASKRHHWFPRKKIHKPMLKKSGGVGDRYPCKIEKDDSNATCAMCGKTFPSMKSLFGHMRSHPDREWRGVHPPARSNRSMLVAVLESAGPCGVRDRARDDPDYTSQISSPAPRSTSEWGVNGKGSCLSLVASDWVSSEVELEASDNLLLLAEGTHALSKSSSTSRQESKSAEGDNCNAKEVIKGKNEDKARGCPELVRVSKKQKMESSPPDKKVKRESSLADRAYTTTVGAGKGKEKMDEFQGCDDHKGYSHERSNEAKSNCKDGEYKVTQDQLELNIPLEKGNIEKKKRKRSSRNSEAGADGIARCQKISKTSERIKCNICDKSFSTHQGLGGHMSSHSKLITKKSQSGDDHEVSVSTDQEADEFRSSAATATHGGADAECLENDGGADAECSGDSGDGPPSVQASGCKMLAIDLNKLPPTDEG